MARRRKKKKEERDRGVKLHRGKKKKETGRRIHRPGDTGGNEKRGCDEEEHERKEENEKD